MDDVPRLLSGPLAETLAARRVVVLAGPRQAGKTTLTRHHVASVGSGTMLRLDDPAQLASVQADPRRALSGERPVVIDEVQRAGDDVVRAVKMIVDDDRASGQFLLTGSSNFLTVPTISESLAGRASLLSLWPLAQAELEGASGGLLRLAFDAPDDLLGHTTTASDLRDVVERLVRGGYPEVQDLAPSGRSRWFDDYVATTIQRDVVELSGIRRSGQLRHLLRVMAARTAQELVMDRVARDVDLSRQTLYDYREWLHTIHLLHELPAWSTNLSKRLRKRPKVVVTDSGLATHLTGRDADALLDGDPMLGPLLETFVATEVLRLASWTDPAVEMAHYRAVDGAEIDLVLERRDGSVVGIEVKAGSSPRPRDARHLAGLRDDLDALDRRFAHGFVLHTGPQALPLGDRLTAIPISALWTT